MHGKNFRNCAKATGVPLGSNTRVVIFEAARERTEVTEVRSPYCFRSAKLCFVQAREAKPLETIYQTLQKATGFSATEAKF